MKQLVGAILKNGMGPNKRILFKDHDLKDLLSLA